MVVWIIASLVTNGLCVAPDANIQHRPEWRTEYRDWEIRYLLMELYPLNRAVFVILDRLHARADTATDMDTAAPTATAPCGGCHRNTSTSGRLRIAAHTYSLPSFGSSRFGVAICRGCRAPVCRQYGPMYSISAPQAEHTALSPSFGSLTNLT